MPKKLYEIRLTAAEQAALKKTVQSGTASARTILRANILLQSNASNSSKPKSTRELALLLNTSTTTIQNVRKEYVGSNIKETLGRKKRETPPIERKIDGDVEAHIIALACMDPPQGYSRWTLRLLADKTVELGIIDDISYVSVGKVLKKTSLSLT